MAELQIEVIPDHVDRAVVDLDEARRPAQPRVGHLQDRLLAPAVRCGEHGQHPLGGLEPLDRLEAEGLRVAPSQANFVMVDVDRAGRAVYEALLREGVIVRPMPAPLESWLRVTIGLPSENERFLDALRQRIESRHHAVVVVAEGAGQHLFESGEATTDASGNFVFNSINTSDGLQSSTAYEIRIDTTQAAIAIRNADLYDQAQQEIAERRRVEAELRESEDRFRALIEQSPYSTVIYDATGRTLYGNPAASIPAGSKTNPGGIRWTTRALAPAREMPGR